MNKVPPCLARKNTAKRARTASAMKDMKGTRDLRVTCKNHCNSTDTDTLREITNTRNMYQN